jgi:hypothetical protein
MRSNRIQVSAGKHGGALAQLHLRMIWHRP